MDELIAKLRGTQPEKQEAGRQEDSRQDTPKRLCKSSTETPDLSEACADDSEAIEITTSQGDHPGRGFQLDFDLLQRHRSAAEEHMTAAEVRRTPLYRLEHPFYALVKSIEPFGNNVHRWELCDETGVVSGSSRVREGVAGVGDVVCLSRCSLWKASCNHLNIVDANIKTVVKYGDAGAA